MFNLYSAICDYERAWSEPSLSDEEWEEKSQDYQDHLDHMANNAIDEMRLSGEW